MLLPCDGGGRRRANDLPYTRAERRPRPRAENPEDSQAAAAAAANNCATAGGTAPAGEDRPGRSRNDDKVDDKEKEKIATEVVELEKKISELKLKLNLGDKTDYKSQKKEDLPNTFKRN